MVRFIVLALALVWASPASAAPVTYVFTSGSAIVTADTFPSGTSVVAPTPALPLSGTFVEFDDMVPSLLDFEITLAPTGPIPVLGGYGGFSTFEILTATLEPDVGFSATVTPLGPGTFSVSASGVHVVADYLASPPPTGPIAIDFPTTFTGTIDIVAMTLELDEFSLALIPGASLGEAEDLLVKADVMFTGTVVPEPTAGLLILAALGTLVARARLPKVLTR